MSAVVSAIQGRALDTIVGRLTPDERFTLARRLVAEMPAPDRQRLLAGSPGFVTFATQFVASLGRRRVQG